MRLLLLTGLAFFSLGCTGGERSPFYLGEIWARYDADGTYLGCVIEGELDPEVKEGDCDLLSQMRPSNGPDLEWDD